MGTGAAVATDDIITAAKMNLKLEEVADADLVHDSGVWTVGEDGAGQDITFYTDAAGKKMLWDSSDNSLKLDDAVILAFGDYDDVEIQWTGALLTILPATNDLGAINIGDGTTDIDVKIFLGSATKNVLFDVGASAIILEAVGIDVNSATLQAFKAEYNVTAQLGAWAHGIKVELTRAADIQPVTGGWYGGQFVLNAGSSGYAALNKAAYALAAIFKGSDTNPDGVDIHVARFETQSAGKVSDICYITANAGTTIVGSLLYLATHVAPGNSMLCINVQSSQIVAEAIHFEAGAGSTLTSLLYCKGEGTFVNLLEVAASGDGGVTVGLDGMDKNPQSDNEAGYVTIKAGAASYQMPFYALT